jgi:hypothetical protein
MIKLIFLLHLFLSPLPPDTSGQEIKVSCHYNNVRFSEFCIALTAQTGVKIFYKEEWVKDLIISIDVDSVSMVDVVNQALISSHFKASVWHNHIVIMRDYQLPDGLPAFESPSIATDTAKNAEKSITLSEERYLTGRKSDVTRATGIGVQGGAGSSGKAKIMGRITDIETGEPIIGATLFVEETKTGCASDNNGFLAMIIKPGRYTTRFECIGYEKKKYLFDIYSDGSFKIELKKAIIQMKMVTVYGDKQTNIRSKDAGLERVAVKSIKEIPALMGERNILKISQMLPGIVSVGEGSAGINVRGGNSDQNAFYINRIPVYNTSHLFGFFPAFNSDIIQDFTIYKGFVPASYGGRLSSVFNLVTRQGNRKRITARGGISPVAANIVVDGPLIKDTCSFSLSARSSYSDWILKKLNDPMIRESEAGFNDFSAAVNYDLRKTQVAVFAYRSFDRFRLADINEYEYANNGASVNVGYNFSNTLRGSISVIASQYQFNTIDKQIVSSAYKHGYSLNHYELKTDFNHVLSDKNTLTYGAGLVLYRLERGTVEPFGVQSLRLPVVLGTEQGLESAVYVADNYDMLPGLHLNIGCRLALYAPLGPEDVMLYNPGSPIDLRYVVDTLHFSSGKPLKYYVEPDFRISVNYETGENSSLKASFNQMHQNIFMLNNTVSISPNSQWKLADYYIKPSKSNQYSLGWFLNIPKGNWETSAEVYYKDAGNFTEFKDGADFLNNPYIETSVLQGDMKSWGIEFMLKRNARKLDGWISYTYSRSRITVNGTENWLKINNGETYPSSFDIPHVLNALINYHINRRLTLSSVISYQTGKPVTFPVSVYYIDEIPYIDYSKRNEYRIPDYFRADLSLTVEGTLQKNKILHSSLVFSIYNITGRDNPYSVYFKNENRRITSYQYSVIGVPVFTITWLFKFGNYASE